MTQISTKMGKLITSAAVAGGLLASAFAATTASAQDKVTLGLPGVPPIFGAIYAYVAKDAGFYKKYNLDVTLRPFNSGVAATKAVAAGQLDAAMGPTPPATVLVSNANLPITMISGMEINDWMLGSMDPAINSCEKVKGVKVGVDSPRGARWIQLANMIRPCKLMPDRDVPTVNLSTNVGANMVAGKLKLGVLHSDDIPVIERESGKKVTIVARVEETSPGSHYAVIVANPKSIADAKKRDQLVRLAAAHLEAQNMLYDKSKWPEIAKMAAPTGRNVEDSLKALEIFTNMNYWPRSDAGLDQKRIERAVAIQTGVGKRTGGKSGINPEKTPASYDRLTDLSIVEDALALIKKTNTN